MRKNERMSIRLEGWSFIEAGTKGYLAMDLIDRLVSSRLGLTEQQARAVLGLLLGYAKSKFSDGEFTKLSDAIPDSGALMAEVRSVADAELSDKPKDSGGGPGGPKELALGFAELGIEPPRAQRLLAIVAEYLRERSPEAASVLNKSTQHRGGFST